MNQAVYEEFYPKIYNYVYYRVLHRENAEDITGEVFYKALANAASFDPRRASYATWLFSIAHNRVVNFYRDRKNVISFEDFTGAEIGNDEASPLDTVIEDEETRRLYALLSELPERERTVLALRFWGEFSYTEIAAQMGLTVNNVGVIINRTIEKLRSLW